MDSSLPPTSQNPTDVSLTSVLPELDGAGFAGQFTPLEGGSVRCLSCREEFAADRIEADQVRRLEGVSDPADMVIVVPLTCPHCETKGVLVAHYGAEASPEEGDVVVALTRTPTSGHGTDTAPGGTA